MKGRFFIDTNVFVYQFDTRDPEKARRASALIRRAIASKSGVISYQVVQEFLNVAFKKFRTPLSVRDAEQYLLTVFRPLLAVYSSPRLFLEAMRVREAHGLAWYDSLLISAAVHADCETFYTEDMQDGRHLEGIRIENPFAA